MSYDGAVTDAVRRRAVRGGVQQQIVTKVAASLRERPVGCNVPDVRLAVGLLAVQGREVGAAPDPPARRQGSGGSGGIDGRPTGGP